MATNGLKAVRLKNLADRKVTAKQLADLSKEKKLAGGYSYWQGVLNGSKSFGEKVARQIEGMLDMDVGALDRSGPAPVPEPAGRLVLNEMEIGYITLLRVIAARDPQRALEITHDLNAEAVRAGAPVGNANPFKGKLPPASKRAENQKERIKGGGFQHPIVSGKMPAKKSGT